MYQVRRSNYFIEAVIKNDLLVSLFSECFKPRAARVRAFPYVNGDCLCITDYNSRAFIARTTPRTPSRVTSRIQLAFTRMSGGNGGLRFADTLSRRQGEINADYTSIAWVTGCDILREDGERDGELINYMYYENGVVRYVHRFLPLGRSERPREFTENTYRVRK